MQSPFVDIFGMVKEIYDPQKEIFQIAVLDSVAVDNWRRLGIT